MYMMNDCMHVCELHLFLGPVEIKKESVGPPWTESMNSCELTRGCREQSLGSLQEQQVLLTIDPSLQPQH